MASLWIGGLVLNTVHQKEKNPQLSNSAQRERREIKNHWNPSKTSQEGRISFEFDLKLIKQMMELQADVFSFLYHPPTVFAPHSPYSAILHIHNWSW